MSSLTNHQIQAPKKWKVGDKVLIFLGEALYSPRSIWVVQNEEDENGRYFLRGGPEQSYYLAHAALLVEPPRCLLEAVDNAEQLVFGLTFRLSAALVNAEGVVKTVKLVVTGMKPEVLLEQREEGLESSSGDEEGSDEEEMDEDDESDSEDLSPMEEHPDFWGIR